MKQNTEQIEETQIIQTPVKLTESKPIEPCSPPCTECLRHGCCRTCFSGKVVKFTSPNEYIVKCEGVEGFGYREVKVKVGSPVLIGVKDGMACPNYRCKYLKNLLTGELIELI